MNSGCDLEFNMNSHELNIAVIKTIIKADFNSGVNQMNNLIMKSKEVNYKDLIVCR